MAADTERHDVSSRHGNRHSQNRLSHRSADRRAAPGRRGSLMTRRARSMRAASASSSTSRTSPARRSSRTASKILENLEHRGAVGADPLMGDGAGIMVQIPHKFFVKERRTARLPPCPSRASTPSASSSCRRTPTSALKMERVVNKVDRGRRPDGHSAGATCRPTTPR